eukprot:5266610-Heterocapsa_arctica.AAC.1
MARIRGLYWTDERTSCNYYRTEITDLGRHDVSIDSISDGKGKLRQIDEWPGFVKDGVQKARNLSCHKAAEHIPHYRGVEN